MDLTNLKNNNFKLLKYLKESNYSKSYILKFKSEIKWILSNPNFEKWTCYKDIYYEQAMLTESDSYQRNLRTIIGAIERFDIYGKFPDGRTRHKLTKRSSYDYLIDNYKNIINLYCKLESKRGKKQSTINTEANNASVFLLYLQQQKVSNLNDVTEKLVLLFFLSKNGELKRSCSYKKNISAVFKACIQQYPKSCKKILSYLPLLRERRKTIQYLTRVEIHKIKDTLHSKNTLLTLRDRAIGILILYTGIRGCDVAQMSLESIDWSKEIIVINQSKTNITLKLPLSVIVGNAIFDYLKEERPLTHNNYLFIRQNKPYDRLKDGSIGNIATKIMKLADIRKNAYDRKGFHLFRHHLATTLLKNNVPQPVISRSLGHTSPKSLEPYLSADFVHLKKCSLSIEKFPIIKEVFLDE